MTTQALVTALEDALVCSVTMMQHSLPFLLDQLMTFGDIPVARPHALRALKHLFERHGHRLPQHEPQPQHEHQHEHHHAAAEALQQYLPRFADALWSIVSSTLEEETMRSDALALVMVIASSSFSFSRMPMICFDRHSVWMRFTEPLMRTATDDIKGNDVMMLMMTMMYVNIIVMKIMMEIIIKNEMLLMMMILMMTRL